MSQTASMQHTRRCTRHHGLLMPECPSQWGCPVKSLGVSALLCFYTQVERWKWSYCEMNVQDTQKRQYSMCSSSNNNIWQMKFKTDSVGQKKFEIKKPLWNYFYKGVTQIISTSLFPLIWALPYLVLYEPCPSLQASCSSLINIRVFWLLHGCDWKKTMHHLQIKTSGLLTLISWKKTR